MLQRKCSCGGTPGPTGECENCRKNREAKEGIVQRAAVDQGSVTEVPPSVHEVLQSSGQALEPQTRAFMESRFDHDFSRVRLHTDGQAASSANAVKARAYTVGEHVVFAEGQHTSSTSEGLGLMAHELSHVIQQNSRAIPENLSLGNPEDLAEVEARQATHSILEQRKPVLNPSRISPQLQKSPIGESDPIHQPLLEQFRREHGLPLSGIDEFGNQVGPTDADIKYGGLLLPRPRQATPAEQREFTEDAIRFLETAADFYRAVTRIQEARLAQILQGWQTTFTSNLQLISQSLNNDAGLTQRLTRAYQTAVRSLLFKAASLLRKTPQDLYQQFVGVIHEVAWWRGTTDPTGSQLSDALPETERQRIRVLTTGINFASVAAYFQPNVTMVPLPQNVTVRFSSGVSQGLRRGLENMVGELSNGTGWQRGAPLEPNSTLTLALHLENVGGDYSAYRFTYVQRQPQGGSRTGEVLIEHLGAVGMETLHPTQAATAQRRFNQHNFQRGLGWSDAQFQEVLAAVDQMPDATLSLVDGYTFNRVGVHPTLPERCGEHDASARTITIFDCAFNTSLTRTGVPGQNLANEARRDVLHEVGHALDLRALMQALTPVSQALDAQRAAFRQYEQPPGSNRYSIPPGLRPRWDRLQAQIRAAEQTRDATRSHSGAQWQLTPGTNTLTMIEGADNVAFRQAAQQDGGLRITHYSDTDWREHFADSYSLYMTDPDGLRRLRPHVYEFFNTNFPR